jgi:chromate transport protein ChrA
MPTPDHFKYIGLATQILATLGVAFFIGYHIDRYLGLRIPVALILLPLLMLVGLLWKIIKDTSNKSKK